MQCQGHRGNGETFTADVWFSTYKEGSAPKLAAIVADLSEEEADGTTGNAQGVPTAQPPERRQRAALNGRETEVLRLLVQGLANKEIAARMEISESAVKNTIQQLFAKTGVRTRSQLVRVALEDYRKAL
jgi:two-component system nitrate/nitrite response regulator NarL